MNPEMSLEAAVTAAQKDIIDLQGEFKQLHEFVTGNGDPQHGLLWTTTLQGRLLTDLSTIVEANRIALTKHETDGHVGDARQGTWTRLGFEVAKSVTVWVIVGFLAFAVANVHISIGNAPH